ncbi:hypothetical protein AAZX31_10G095000 [Glycine max]
MIENENTQNLDIGDLEKDEVSKNKAKQTDINEVQEALKTRSLWSCVRNGVRQIKALELISIDQ